MTIRIKTNVSSVTSAMEAYVMYIANKLQEIRFGKAKEVRIFQLAELKTWSLWRAVLAEFVATLLFVFLGAASTIPLGGAQSNVKIAFAFGIAIMALIQMFGHISGGHINPAVSLALAAIGVVTPIRALLYVVAQTVGGILGGLILKGVTPSAFHGNLGVTAIAANLNVGQGFGVELILTFVLIFVIVATTDSNRSDAGMVSVAIGLTIALLHLAGIEYTGASMNPARTLGSAVASDSFQDIWVYWVAPIVGGVVASILYKFLFSPYRNGVTMDAAVSELLQDGDMIVIPKDYFKDNSHHSKFNTSNSHL